MSTASDTSPLPSRIGSYDVVRPIAEGGMGAVYEVEHRVTKQRRALKVVRAELARNADFRARFVREVTIASTVRHPNLVETQDPIEDGDVLALPMELLQGETLSSRLRRGPMSVSELLEVVVPCCQAIHAVHERSVIHRDLKPLNVFLARDGERVTPKVLDFGAAREIDDDEHTRTGVAIGSPFYMAPEQAEGRKDLDRRVDVYAMGVISYVCLTGRKLYATDSAQSAIAKLLRAEKITRPTELRPDLSLAVEAAVMRAIAYDREDRWPTLASFAEALEEASRAPSDASDASEATFLHDVSLRAAEAEQRGENASGVRASTGAGFEKPPPVTTATARPTASDGSGRGAQVFAVVAVLIAIALGAWWFTRPTSPPATVLESAAPDAARPTQPAVDPTAGVPATIVTPSEPPPSTAIRTELGPADPPPSDAPIAPAIAAPAPPAPAPPTTVEPTPRRTPRPPRSTSTSGAQHEDAPCGLAVGIPCIE